VDDTLILDHLRRINAQVRGQGVWQNPYRIPNKDLNVVVRADLTEKRRIEKARTPMRRRVKVQSTPPKASRRRPPPPLAVEED
jgi:hypothetical protein